MLLQVSTSFSKTCATTSRCLPLLQAYVWDSFEDRGYRRWIRGELWRNREVLGNQEVLAVSSLSNNFTAYDCLLSISTVWHCVLCSKHRR
jgi:hypothetical protein